jgi:hypothetical protein
MLFRKTQQYNILLLLFRKTQRYNILLLLFRKTQQCNITQRLLLTPTFIPKITVDAILVFTAFTNITSTVILVIKVGVNGGINIVLYCCVFGGL